MYHSTQVNLIAAVAKNRAIGYQNQLLFHIEADLKRFKTLTLHHPIIMGRHTFLSLPHGPLPQRRNIVLSQTVPASDGCEVATSLEAALQLCAHTPEVFIIGGASVYQQAMPFADKLYLTEVDATPKQADSFFPPFTDWVLTNHKHFPKTPTSPAFSFNIYEK